MLEAGVDAMVGEPVDSGVARCEISFEGADALGLGKVAMLEALDVVGEPVEGTVVAATNGVMGGNSINSCVMASVLDSTPAASSV